MKKGTMDAIKKETLSRTINNLVAPMGGKFRFAEKFDKGTLRGSAGYFDLEGKTIVLTVGAPIATLAHEIAHLDQQNREGTTNCRLGEQAVRHSKLTKKWLSDLDLLGITL